MTTAGPSIPRRHSPHSHSHNNPSQSSYHQYRHHPYAPPSTSNPNSSSNSAKQPRSSSSQNGELPPSPPRSRRDASETPSIGLGVAFGGAAGGKWWDEELPPPPASLSSILDSFRKSGEGDRDLLLSILGAKKAEEERLTALIQTRLTILQARLSLHSAAASLPPIQMPLPGMVENDLSPRSQTHGSMPPPQSIPGAIPVERTPSLTSSRGPGSSSSGMASPPLPQQTGYIQPSPPQVQQNTFEKERERESRGYWQLPSLQSSLRAPSQTININSRSPHSPGLPLAPIKEVRIIDRRPTHRNSNNGSVSPSSSGSEGKRSGSGLEMLLDAGRVVNESAERDH
ncbi:uncharacterized protein IL334_000662 [Kwoniella shivajii]|uniref:Uncharacterized protein n=1 Tax=Kwoniella shivajii TaxID=564305 RepID=A0ABZ1CR95_9TREE|nr:hypothetical protein IL334_000662 [Kwoniella shivajii]